MAARPADVSPPASLMQWLDACPTPFHVVERAVQMLAVAGFEQQRLFASDSSGSTRLARRGVLVSDGTIIAWRLGAPGRPFRILGAHTDSPNLRVQPNPSMTAHGVDQLGIEIYGGVLLNSWLDRDLALAGRVVARDGSTHLFDSKNPIARIPQLAIHLDRDVNERGVVLDKHQHLTPVWGMSGITFESWLARLSGVDAISAWDAHLYDATPAALVGHDSSLLASARLDNQASCWAAIEALCANAATEGPDGAFTTIVVLNDHEEVGSASSTGAAGPLLSSLIEIISEAEGLTHAQHRDRITASWCLSADNAHGIHPNYPERHDPRHAPRLNHGPALKLNGNQRYATSARGAAHLRTIADDNSLPLQTFVSRNNMPCGSTIGPITATALGIDAIDIGIPQWSMHSARETCGASDPGTLAALMTAFLAR